MMQNVPMLAIALVATAVLPNPCAVEGRVTMDICVPTDASDPFEHGHVVRVNALERDGEIIVDFVLHEGNVQEELSAFPIGARVAFRVQVLDPANNIVAQGEHPTVEIREQTPVCVCVASMSEQSLCDDLHCSVQDHTCVFHSVAQQ